MLVANSKHVGTFFIDTDKWVCLQDHKSIEFKEKMKLELWADSRS